MAMLSEIIGKQSTTTQFYHPRTDIRLATNCCETLKDFICSGARNSYSVLEVG
jgi:hypothetical protein